MIKVIVAEKVDANELKNIAIEAFYDDIELYGAMPPKIDTLQWHEEYIKDGMYYKIMYDNIVVGGIRLFKINDEHFRIGTIYIHPSYHNKKIGTKCFKIIEELYPKVKKWVLDTPYKSYRNHHFYEKLGYIKVGEEHPIKDNDFCLFLYEKQKK